MLIGLIRQQLRFQSTTTKMQTRTRSASKSNSNGSTKRAASDSNKVEQQAPSKKAKKYDKEQEKFMTEEFCIVVDEKDEIIGKDTKKNCHLNVNIEKGLLHRAFSVFLFDTEGRLLLQQRSDKKITFPDCWTNTCCSHPIDNEPDERTGLEGVKRAAVRKLKHELGIEASEIPVTKANFKFLTRIHYKAPSNDEWGEHEIDYIFFVTPPANPKVDGNPGEVKDTKYVTSDELRKMLEESKANKIQITPWFRMICEKFLFGWWETLLKNPKKLKTDDMEIHKVE